MSESVPYVGVHWELGLNNQVLCKTFKRLSGCYQVRTLGNYTFVQNNSSVFSKANEVQNSYNSFYFLAHRCTFHSKSNREDTFVAV